MQELSNFVYSLLAELNVWEACAVILAICYLLLAAQENVFCWYCALISTAIYTFLFWDVSLLMESALNVYYMAMAVYGWYLWKFAGDGHHGIAIRTLQGKHHFLIIAVVLIVSVISGSLLGEHTNAAWPFIDSFTTWSSVITTIMVAKKILENWLYWFVIDAISIPLYIDRGLYLTAILFACYLVIVVLGYLNWRKRFTIQNDLADTN